MVDETEQGRAAGVFDVLSDPVGESLRGRHAHLARTHGLAAAYLPGVATFVAVQGDSQKWGDLAALLGSGGYGHVFTGKATPPQEWQLLFELAGRVMVGPTMSGPSIDVRSGTGPEVVELGDDDVPEMLDLVRRTDPGPFGPHTHRMGTYLGIRDGGRLVAMAGERLKPPGFTEISAVCTDPAARGRGLAAFLVDALADRIRAHGERPFLHVLDANTGAIALYERLGFETVKPVTFRSFRVP